jgi:cysteine desulfuration protein SufE
VSNDSEYPERLRELLDTIDTITDVDERSALLIDFAERFKSVPPTVAQRPYPESHRVSFCESEAYVWGFPQADGTLKFHFAVENPSGVSARALAAILEKTASGAPLRQVAAIGPEIVARVFRQNISMGKGMGLGAMVQMVRSLAAGRGRSPKP